MTTASVDGWQCAGKHRMRFEAPDVLVLIPDGDMRLAEQKSLIAYAKSCPLPAKGFFYVVDVTKGGRSDPAALKDPEVIEFGRQARVMLYFGASFYHRTMLNIFSRAGKALGASWAEVPVHVFATEAEARAWIEEERRKD